LKFKAGKKRVAVSELVGTLVMVAVTLVAGAAVFGWIDGQAGVSETAYGQSVAKNVNFLNERFSAIAVVFQGGGTCSGGECTSANFSIYNTGSVSFTLYSVRVLSLNSSQPLDATFYYTSSAGCQGPNSLCFSASAGSSSCSSSNSNFLINPPTYPLPQSKLSSDFEITTPTNGQCSAGPLYLYSGSTYTFTLVGLYGNTVATTVTVNG
jgi:flagellin-like protein